MAEIDCTSDDIWVGDLDLYVRYVGELQALIAEEIIEREWIEGISCGEKRNFLRNDRGTFERLPLAEGGNHITGEMRDRGLISLQLRRDGLWVHKYRTETEYRAFREAQRVQRKSQKESKEPLDSQTVSESNVTKLNFGISAQLHRIYPESEEARRLRDIADNFEREKYIGAYVILMPHKGDTEYVSLGDVPKIPGW